MRVFNILICSIYSLGIISFETSAKAQSIKGNVIDSEGASIEGALIVVHEERAPHGIPPLIVFSDKEGNFTSEVKPGFVLNPGLIDVCVMAVGFTPVCQKARIETGEQAPLHFYMKVDPLAIH